MELVEDQFKYLFNDCSNNGLTVEDIHKLCVEHIRTPELKAKFRNNNFDKRGDFIYNRQNRTCRTFCRKIISGIFYGIVILSACAIVGCLAFYVIYGREDFLQAIETTPCLLDHNEISAEFTRPLFNCSVCQGISAVSIVQNIDRETFEEFYAYTGVPLVVKNAKQQSWEQTRKLITFDFLKNLYQSYDGALDMVSNDCQFFPYNTDFRSLAEVFNMSSDMSAMLEKKWYVGWSNCVPAIEKELRKYYQEPDFLPKDSDSTHIDWIFMGGWGYGAPMHIDNLERPSWQAQLSGRKTWVLAPSVECEGPCHTLQVTVETGDIIFLDTNEWFHSTYIHPGEISITIGSEYD